MTQDRIANSGIISITIEKEMQKSYLDYAMSVIVSRALPDVRDGLKPVHRRILHAMNEAGFDYNKAYKKSARVTGDVMAKYHPHGNAAIYDAMVRMAQDFSLRLPLIDGQGNFGSMDGDPAAAERYTEARLAKISRSLLDDIDKDTVDFCPNYDGSEQEPVVLPSKFPNLLVNGANGIAVGMATNIPPHNLGELVDACIAYIANNDISVEELMQFIQGPDFPTGGIIVGARGIYSTFSCGRGSIIIRAKSHVEEIRKDKQAIILTEIPYQVNKAKMIERIAETVKNKIISGISDLRDESDRDGVRVVIELKRDAVAEVVLNQLYRHTPVQTSFGSNMLALDKGMPKLLNVRNIIALFIKFREEVIVRRIKFILKKDQSRAHILIGLSVAVTNLDEIIALIKRANDPQSAKQAILAKAWETKDVSALIELVNEPGNKVEKGTYKLSEEQAKAILELKLHRLTGLERNKIANELKEIVEQIKKHLAILASREKILSILKNELIAVKEEFATPRRTTIDMSEANFDIEELIQKEEMVITVSQNGYIKRVPLSTYKSQRRGGRGRSGMSTREEDVVSEVFIANTHTPILFFTSRGLAYVMKVYKLPIGSPQSLGKALVNLLPIEKDELISAIMPITGTEDELKDKSIIFVVSSGTVRRNNLSDFLSVRANGKIAMKLEGNEELISVKMCTDNQDIFLTTKFGKCIRFHVNKLRIFASRNSTGVRGIDLRNDDKIVSLTTLDNVECSREERQDYLRKERGNNDVVDEQNLTIAQSRKKDLSEKEQFVISITNRGFGKISSAYQYRTSNRGGVGIANMALSERNGYVLKSFLIDLLDELVLVTNKGRLIRLLAKDLRIAGRSTQGVTLFRIDNDEKVVSVAKIPFCDLNDDEDDEDGRSQEELGEEKNHESKEELSEQVINERNNIEEELDEQKTQKVQNHDEEEELEEKGNKEEEQEEKN